MPSPVLTLVATASESEPPCCDVCQHRPALVTLGCVDYCAVCAPIWHPSFGAADAAGELDRPVLEVVR